MIDADVVVVGCGPVGVMCALRCAQRGLSVIAVDQMADIYPLPRAIGMDDEIQRVFESAGLGPAVREHSTPMVGAEFVDAEGSRLVGFEFPPGMLGPVGHPPMVTFDQPSLERALREAATDAGVRFLLEHEALTIDPVDQGVELALRKADGSEITVVGRWLVATDGASSTIRRLLDIQLVDLGFDQMWLVVDATLTDPTTPLPRMATQFCDPERVVTFVRGHGTRRRWEFQLRDDETGERMEEPERVAELLSRWGTPDQLTVDRTAVYRFHATVAERFREGPVFIAGDAAHQMPPFNGQGMCSGIRDAENLNWKLAMVADGLAGDALLDTYEAERRPHAAGQVEHSADVGRLIDALARGDDASTASGYGGGRPFPHLEHGVLDGQHPHVGHQLPQPKVEGRPLDDMLGDGFALVTSHSVPAALEEQWRTLGAEVVVLDQSMLPGMLEAGATAIVRPDRYVAAVTTDLDTTTRRLTALMGVPIGASR